MHSKKFLMTAFFNLLSINLNIAFIIGAKQKVKFVWIFPHLIVLIHRRGVVNATSNSTVAWCMSFSMVVGVACIICFMNYYKHIKQIIFNKIIPKLDPSWYTL